MLCHSAIRPWLAGVLFATMCASSDASSSNRDPLIAIGVTSCSKTFLVQIYEDGTVNYLGIRGVATIGKFTKHIDPAGLIEKANRIEIYPADRELKLIVEAKRFTAMKARVTRGLVQASSDEDLLAAVLLTAKLEGWAGFSKSDLVKQRAFEDKQCLIGRNGFEISALKLPATP